MFNRQNVAYIETVLQDRPKGKVPPSLSNVIADMANQIPIALVAPSAPVLLNEEVGS